MKKDSKQRLFEVMGRLDKTFKPKLNEGLESIESEVEVEPQEHQEEGISNKVKLKKVAKMAKNARKSLPDGEIPSWVQDNITIANERLDSVCNWLKTEIEHEEFETPEEEKEEHEEGEEEEEEAEDTDSVDDEDTDDSDDDEEKESKPNVPVKNW